MSTKMSGSKSHSVSSDMHAGMSRKEPRAEDASKRLPKGPSVDKGAIRDMVAAHPKSLGPRNA